MPCPQSNERVVTYFCGSDVRCNYENYENYDNRSVVDSLDCPPSPSTSCGSNDTMSTMSNVTRGANRAASIITGNCQSRKTKTTIDELVSLFKADVGSEDSALLLVITQSNSTQNAYQMAQRMESHVELSQIFPTFLGMERKNALRPPTSKAARCAMVRYFHKANIAAMMDVATSRHWDHLYLVVDEADMGNDEGVLKRLSAIHSLDCALATSDVFATVASGMFVDAARPALRVIFVTATPINLCKTVHDIGTKHLNTFPEGSLVRNILEHGIAVDHTWVTPHESYVSLEWFKEHDLVHIIADPVKPKVSKSADHVGQDPNPTEPEEPDLISLRTDAAFDVMRTLSKKRQRLMMVSISSKRDDHTQLAERLIHEDISDLVVCLNSQNGKNYMVHTHHNAWAIPNKQLADAADRGAFRLYMNDMGQMHDTGIASCHDVPLSHILLCATTRPCDLPALLSSIEDATTRYQIRTLSQWFMTNANRNPHMPTKGLMRVALVGGNLLNRGITIQDARVGFVCTSFVFMDGPTRADGGASHTQKVGRALGNLLPVFQEFKPLLLISAGMYESAMANERLTRRHGMRTHGTSIQIGDYIPHEEFVRERKEIRASHTQAAVKTVGTKTTKVTKPKERSKRTALRGAARVAFTLRLATHPAVASDSVPDSLLLLTEPLSPELTAVLPMMPVLPSDPANKAQRGAMQTAYRAKVLAALKKRGLTFPNIQVTWGNRVTEFDAAAYVNSPNYETGLVVGAIDGKMHAMRMHRVNVQAFRHDVNIKAAAMYTLDGRMHVLEKTGV